MRHMKLQLVEKINEFLHDSQFFRNFINLGKLILKNEKNKKNEYPIYNDYHDFNYTIYNDFFNFKDNGGFFYEILNFIKNI